ncbi:MAG TPA: SHOCT domain-containing protein [Miltoncostaeaceae bacterium]|nr:SHOCT domain-containing protein [Miltoncostaeaceae bacterium]
MSNVLGNLTLDISFGEFLWSLVIIFFMIVFFVILFQVVFDLFRDHELSGWAKAGWLIFIIVLPFLGLFVYLIVRGKGMAQRSAREQVEAKQQFDAYVRETAGGGGGAATEIANAKKLLDEGTISQEEFDAIKRKALG